MATEKLKFKLELYSTYWDKKPIVDIKVNNTPTDADNKNHFDNESNKPILNINPSYFSGEIDGTKEKPTLIEFEHFCEENKNYQFDSFLFSINSTTLFYKCVQLLNTLLEES